MKRLGPLRAAVLGIAAFTLAWGGTPVRAQKRYAEPEKGVTEVFPFISYDTDAGFGVGVKAFALNHLGAMESFDGTLFWSTKGERWVRGVFSLRDFELRQGTVYPWAVDVVADYDKWISTKFFGVGNESSYDSLETYTREPLELSVTLSRGFLEDLVGSLAIRYRNILNSDLEPGGLLATLPPALNQSKATSLGIMASLRFDTRDSYIHPTSGMVLTVEAEGGPESFAANVAYGRGLVMMNVFQLIRPLATILAARVMLEGVAGSEIPVQMLARVGGTKTLRGYVQDRYLDRVSGIVNVELRFPILWRFGGIVGIDAGKVWPDPGSMDLTEIPTSPVIGLRFYMDTFVVRGDVGFGKETTGIYLNFGHLF